MYQTEEIIRNCLIYGIKKIGEYEADIKKQCEYYNVTLQR